MSISVCGRFLDTLQKLGLYKRPVIRFVSGTKNGVKQVVDDATKK